MNIRSIKVANPFKRMHRRMVVLCAAAIFVFSFCAGTVAYAADYYAHQSVNRSVNDVPWTGEAYLWADLEIGYISYWGTGFTQAQETIDSVAVITEGREYCDWFYLDQDWWETNSAAPGWYVGQSGTGGYVNPGECSWFPGSDIILVNRTVHGVTDDLDEDGYTIDNCDMIVPVPAGDE